MNREECKALMPVMQAYIDEKSIQFRSTLTEAGWVDFEAQCPGLGAVDLQWRVKPEPVVFFVNVYSDKSAESYSDEEDAKAAAANDLDILLIIARRVELDVLGEEE